MLAQFILLEDGNCKTAVNDGTNAVLNTRAKWTFAHRWLLYSIGGYLQFAMIYVELFLGVPNHRVSAYRKPIYVV